VLDPITFLGASKGQIILDVRSESEFELGHIPGAFSLPLFNNDERAIVGTIYKKQNAQKAMEKGLEIAGPKLAEMVNKAKSICGNKSAYVYCWRGGKRSESVAWLLNMAGINSNIMLGGYKAYRSLLPHFCESNLQVKVVGGFTGSAKTELLQVLKNKGEQIIDLEQLANHKGSAFGNLLNETQPSSEHFSNLLLDDLNNLDKSKQVWVEDESKTIGSVFIPNEFYDIMKTAPLFILERSKQERIKHLVDSYGHHSTEELRRGFDKIGKRLGGQHLKSAQESILSGQLDVAVNIALTYYDKKYKHGIDQNDSPKKTLDGKGMSLSQIADELILMS
jgi:tRNA 2-selenouridine synthase